ncbi:reprolysin-like metallopeptidase [Flavilitoribacter nigricans]|uniref:P/Homo B domain-containing protein n=1 Tax=Flavilitoribacter nigricans (strain ATCC 23147 / DSM 23189 / NBRC 102662 / NCIMB 1420 / SS-2) TaxID=1122177 RepID=A0A2D0NHU8_FLAN2|nr:zinc-dependent metalloprotease family protein [Flavilitoribacter nigricans]PHN07343.1 hypothetical protein CRP01_06850 [Flavilitoribacter nigricans DSM 23189 = NBRC 102662]
MISRFLPLVLLLALSTSLSAQHIFWRDVSIAPGTGRSDDGTVNIKQFRPVTVDMSAFKSLLANAPEESAGQGRNTLEVTFPLPNGETETYLVVHSPLMMPRLAAKYPNIQSFRLIGTQRANSSGRMTYGTNGLSAILRTRFGEVYIDALTLERDDLYRVYFGREVTLESDGSIALDCGLSPEMTPETLEADEWEAERPVSGGRSGAASVDLRVYSLALACTGEYAQTHGGTKESVLSSFNEAVSLLTEIYESELSIRFMLIEDIEKLIWLDPQLDPFVNANGGLALVNQISDAFTTDAKISLSSFDLGHLFTGDCTDVGGVAPGRACNFGREKGVTCHSSSNVSLMVRRIMAHEVGHQFSASHSFTNCPPSQGAVVGGKAVEPGSGSTIMSYAGLCGNQNLINDNDGYFHVQSLEEIMTYSREGTGRTCATQISIDNTEPEARIDYADGFYIPVNTPFQLTGSGSDLEDEDLTYCWEQFDVGPLSVLGDPSGNTPLFRSYPPTSIPTRVFPRIEDIVTNTANRNELMADYARDMTFRMTVRDNHPGGGTAAWQEVAFHTTDVAGPFMVLSPDTDRPMWEAGTYQKVVWEVANTNRDPVNCQFVNIRLSTDGGFNYPYVLATGVPNTGSAMVPVPNIETVAARIKVEANDNIFFNISSQNFRITAPTSAGFTMTPSQNNQNVCLPDLVSIDLATQSFLGFNEDITFEVMEGLPNDAAFDFSPAIIKPGETSTLRIDIPDRNNTGAYEVKLRAYVPGRDTVVQTLYLNLTSNDFSDVSIVEPMDGENGIGLTTTLAWTESANASKYEVELANNPSFEDPYLLDASELAEGTTEFEPDVILEENTLHYWRLRPINECSDGEYLPVNTFHTENLICTGFTSNDTPVVIPGSGLPTKTSVISVDFDGTISDLNIPLVKGSYQPVSSLRLSLTSPAGTEVILFDGNCGNTTDLLIGFDDQAPDTLTCPPDDGIVFQPVKPLADFIGESTRGDWTLKVQVISSGFGGVGNIGEWRLEFCASSTPIDPVLVTNDTLYVPPGLANPVMADVLETLDEDNGPEDLKYTLVQAPASGTLYFLDQALSVGDTFRQATINAFNLYYANEDPDARLDQFIFVVEDGTGGWIPPQTFTIKIDNTAIVDTDDPELVPERILLYPNPARSSFRLQLPGPLEQAAQVSLFDARGSQVQRSLMSVGEQEQLIQVGDLPRGLYFVRLQIGASVLTRRVIVQ